MIELKTSTLNRVKRALEHTGPITLGDLYKYLAMKRETLDLSMPHFERLGLIAKETGVNWKKHPRYKLK